MDNKIIINLFVPEIDSSYDIYIPINKKIGNIIQLLNQAINEITNGAFPLSSYNKLYNIEKKTTYNSNTLVINTDIRNGTKLLLLS